MKITIELSEEQLKKLSELTNMGFDEVDLDDEVSYAIGVLISNC